MSLVTLSGYEKSGRSVSDDMFGANAVFQETVDGVPTPEFLESAQSLGVHNIRFGGGQADLNPSTLNSAGVLPQDGVDAINIVALRDGALRPEVVNFLEWCRDTTLQGDAVTATLIIPTKHLSAADYVAFADDIEVFVRLVMQDYPDVVSAFQIGNEYWEMGETAYGTKASIASEAIVRAFDAEGIAEADQPDLWVQMATAGNAGSEFPGVPGVNDFSARNIAANETIIEQLSDVAREAIDGVTEHYYYNKTFYEFLPTGKSVKNINRDFEVWEEAFDKELDLYITEWNVKTTVPEQHGLVSASTLVEQFANMIEIGADGAHVWALDYHSRTALTLDTDAGVRLDDQGRVTNSASGAVFDLMSEALIGKELVFASFSNSLPELNIVSYASDTEMVVYVSSRSFEQTSVTLDLSAASNQIGAVSAVQIALDQSSSNGLQWENGVAADQIIVDGKPYFYNEHDIDVTLTDMIFADAAQVALDLDPFEVVQLTLALNEPVAETGVSTAPVLADATEFMGTQGDDRVILTNVVQKIDGGKGLDSVSIGASRSQVDLVWHGDSSATVSVPGIQNDILLDNIERLSFGDGTLAMDLDGNAGQAYRLYEASFNRDPDIPGLSFWIDQLDAGLSLQDAARAFITSDEFAKAYGPTSALSDESFIDLLYANVLDRAPDQAGYDFWRAQQEAGLGREDILVHFSESEENQSNIAPAISDGIWLV
ncbi:MAG: DUF4214 domain-containing protein [Pseudomonadota bacterium]